jgi:8-oxo-dGTP diphosphatase
MTYSYSYPRPLVTVDLFLIHVFQNKLEILLIQRKNPPFKNAWALPGGYVEIEEDLLSSAQRELSEETGINEISLTELGVFGKPGRDPRGRTITVVFLGILPLNQQVNLVPGDDAQEAEWFQFNSLPRLAFDHQMLIQTCIERFRQNCLIKFWILLFLIGLEFSLSDVQKLFVTVNGIYLQESQIRNLLTNISFISVNSKEEKYRLNNSGSDFFQYIEENLLHIWGKILSK